MPRLSSPSETHHAWVYKKLRYRVPRWLFIFVRMGHRNKQVTIKQLGCKAYRLDLENFFTDVHRYLRFLEEAVIATLKDFGLLGARMRGLTGVWIDHEDGPRTRKVCAIGVRTSRWVTMHGLALNVNTDLSYFDQIIPCGIQDKKVTSMAAVLGVQQDLQMVAQSLGQHIMRLFEMELVRG